jgi:ATP-binding protein involved in chromosome partitioning
MSNPSIRHILAIASGKGGVGKSTTAANLAFALAATGAKVGLCDVDIYGPSMAMMTQVPMPSRMEGALIVPPEIHGVKVISPALFASTHKANIMRGPMAGNVAKQLLTQIAWGSLDFLIIDCPPGTGDIHLTMAQNLSIEGAILVTSPQEVALLDVTKALEFFRTLKIPVLGVIETMSYFLCRGCEEKHYLFGKEGGLRFAQQHELAFLGQVPLSEALTQSGDAGTPLVISAPDHAESQAFFRIRDQLLAQVAETPPPGGLGKFYLKWETPSETSV